MRVRELTLASLLLAAGCGGKVVGIGAARAADGTAPDSGTETLANDSGIANVGVAPNNDQGCGTPSSCAPSSPPGPVSQDAGVDASPAAPGSQGCAPPPELSFNPVPIASISSPTACTQAALDAIYDDCLGLTATTAGCNAEIAAYPTCFDCMVTGYGGGPVTADGGGATSPPAAGPWGPLVSVGPLLSFNLGGCITQVDPSLAPCGTATTDVFECEVAACFSVCPIDPNASPTVLQQQADALATCMAAAATTVCEGETAQANAACAGDDAGPGVQACLQAGDVSSESSFERVITPFCGPAASPVAGSPCAGPAECGGAAPVCCAEVPLSGGTGANCTGGAVSASCASPASCATNIPAAQTLTCTGTQTVRLCASNSDCTEPAYPSCCTTRDAAGPLNVCLNTSLASLIDAPCM